MNLNYLLRGLPVDVFNTLVHTPDSVLFEVLAHEAERLIYLRLKKFYLQYSKRPELDSLLSILSENEEIQDWYKKAGKADQTKYDNLVISLGGEVKDAPYQYDRVMEVLVGNDLNTLQDQIYNMFTGGKMGAKELVKACQQKYDALYLKYATLNTLNPEYAERYLEQGVQRQMFTNRIPLTCKYSPITLYAKAIICILSGSKSGKTTLAINYAYELADMGMDVLLLDGENGDLEYMQRLAQKLMCCTQYTCYSNVYVNPLKINFPAYKKGIYSIGDVVWQLTFKHHFKSQKGFTYEGSWWEVELRFWESLKEDNDEPLEENEWDKEYSNWKNVSQEYLSKLEFSPLRKRIRGIHSFLSTGTYQINYEEIDRNDAGEGNSEITFSLTFVDPFGEALSDAPTGLEVTMLLPNDFDTAAEKAIDVDANGEETFHTYLHSVVVSVGEEAATDFSYQYVPIPDLTDGSLYPQYWKVDVGLVGEEATVFFTVDSPLYEDFTKVTNEVIEARRQDPNKGVIKTVYAKGMTPSDVKEAIVRGMAEGGTIKDGAFADPSNTIVIIDWMGLMNSDTGERDVWKKFRAIYEQLKEIRDETGVTMLSIEGTNTPEEMEKKYTSAERTKAGTQGTIYTGFNLVGQSGIYVSDEEFKVGAARIITIVDRYTAPSIVFCEVDHARQQFNVISKQRHQELCPAFWEEKPSVKLKERSEVKRDAGVLDKLKLRMNN